jgi:hypothetical protein
VSRIAAALEDDLGARLFHRSTAVSLTEFERDPLLSDRGAGHAGFEQFPQLRRRIGLNVLQLFGAI